MKKFNLTITIGLLCAAALLAPYCTEFERDNPLDPRGSNYQRGGGTTQFAVTFNTNGGTPATIPFIVVDSGESMGARFPAAPTMSGHLFVGWFDGATQYTATTPITKDLALTANYQAPSGTYTLTVNAGTGGTVSPSGTSTHNEGTTVQVCATASSGYTFTGWSGASTSTSPCVTITMSGNRTLTANFQQTQTTMYTLTTSVSPTGGGTVSRSPNATSYAAGTTVTVTATAASGYSFTGWSGASTSASSSVTITMSGNRSLTANFQQTQTTMYTLTTSVSPTGGGTVSRSPNAASYAAGTTVTVTATAASGYTFTGWSGTSTSTSSSVTVTMSQNRLLTANFQLQQQTPGSFTDSRDGKSYRTVLMPDGKTWMAENLNYAAASGSYCYGDDPSNCNTYGRLYTWSAAMSACPVGWHLPSDAEWTVLVNAVNTSTTSRNNAAMHLKSQTGWASCGPSGSGSSYQCADTHGFSALPGGHGWYGDFYDAGFYGYWWSATEGDAAGARDRSMYYGNGNVISDWNDKNVAYSVRCLRD